MRIFPKLYSGIFTITSAQAKWDTCKLYVDKVCIFGIINNYNWDNFKWISTTHLVNGPKYFINTKIPCTRNHHRHSNLITPITTILNCKHYWLNYFCLYIPTPSPHHIWYNCVHVFISISRINNKLKGLFTYLLWLKYA